MVSQFLNNPGKTHWLAVKRILQYLKHTADQGLLFEGGSDTPVLGLISDADDANNPDTLRSVSGTLAFISTKVGKRCFFGWTASFQPWVARSACESEIIAIDSTHREGFAYRGVPC